MKSYWSMLAAVLVFTMASPSFAQAVENPFENLLQTTDISNASVGNTVGNGDISANSDKRAQTAPEQGEIPAETDKFSTFSEKFSTEVPAADGAEFVEKSPLGLIWLNRSNADVYDTVFTDRVFSAVWSVDPAEVRGTLNTLVFAEAVTADGTVHALAFDYLALGGNNHYDHDYYFAETLYNDVVEFRFSLHLPEGYDYEPYNGPVGTVYPLVFPAEEGRTVPDRESCTGYALFNAAMEYGEPDPYGFHGAAGEPAALQNLFRLSYTTLINSKETVFHTAQVGFTDKSIVFTLAEPIGGIPRQIQICLFPMDRYRACSAFLTGEFCRTR